MTVLRECGIHHLPVVREGRLDGIIAPVDVLRFYVDHLLPKPPEAG
jgi:CBS domain-containing protein